MPTPTTHGPPRLPPGPAMPPLIQAIHLALRPAAFLDSCARRYGDCFTIGVPGMARQVVFSHPDAIREIFADDGDALQAGRANVILKPVLGSFSLLVLDGPRHRRDRRLLLPPLHGERMRSFAEDIRSTADRAIDRWPLGVPFPLHREMQAITLEVIFRVVFGLGDDGRFSELRARLIELIAVASNAVWLMPWMQHAGGGWLPWGRILRLQGEIRRLLGAEIARRRAADSDAGADVLSMLLQARDEDGTALTDDELCDEMVTLLVAGHETTATALAWAVHHILAHPPVHAAIAAELTAARHQGLAYDARLAQLTFLDATIKETLRLNPIIPEVGRQLDRPMRIGGRDLPAGVVAAASIYLAHRRPESWPDPDCFSPERFIGRRPSPEEFLPFGGGIRRCVGTAFALYEMRCVLARVLERATLVPAPGYRARIVRRSVTLAPSAGMPVVVTRRSDACTS
ncbi:MAG: cytochrome P450 [bacterium]